MLGYTLDYLKEKRGIFTASEIVGQPELWEETFQQFSKVKNDLQVFLDKVLAEKDLNIILTGAGTSAFIGENLEGYFKTRFNIFTRSVHTTDIISFPDDNLYKENTTLIVSFARSGNSPESVGVVELANKLCKKVYHLIITCNEQGKLAALRNNENVFCFVLPPRSNDKSLAMTGSYSSMLLTGVMVANFREFDLLKSKIKLLCQSGKFILDNYTETIKKITEMNFNRGIFLGNGPQLGSAREGHLKLQELTDGKVVCTYDSFLGFRHGPKAVVDKASMILYFFSNDHYASQYELDLVQDIFRRKDGMVRVGIGRKGEHTQYVDFMLEIPGAEDFDETMLCVCSIIPAQLLGFFKSLNVGLSPDEPSVSGNISRVVQGVTIYSYNGNNVESL